MLPLDLPGLIAEDRRRQLEAGAARRHAASSRRAARRAAGAHGWRTAAGRRLVVVGTRLMASEPDGLRPATPPGRPASRPR